MSRKEALAELIAKVEAGDFDETGTTPAKFNAFMGLAEDVLPLDVRFLQGEAWQAYNGSLDAAKSLMMSMLPGWRWKIDEHYAELWQRVQVAYSGESIDNPARAWLLAILRALHSMEPDT